MKRALDQDPKLAVAQYKLGMAYVYTKRERKGAEHLQQAIRHGYEDTEVYQTLGYLYKGLGKRRLAVKAFKSYLRETPDAEMAAATRREMLQQIQTLQR